jgi:hypothetical protein
LRSAAGICNPRAFLSTHVLVYVQFLSWFKSESGPSLITTIHRFADVQVSQISRCIDSIQQQLIFFYRVVLGCRDSQAQAALALHNDRKRCLRLYRVLGPCKQPSHTLRAASQSSYAAFAAACRRAQQCGRNAATDIKTQSGLARSEWQRYLGQLHDTHAAAAVIMRQHSRAPSVSQELRRLRSPQYEPGNVRINKSQCCRM